MVKAKRTTRAAVRYWCWVNGDDVKNMFTVTIGESEMVSSLKELIRSKICEFEKVPAKDLLLYAVQHLSSPLSEDTRLDSQTKIKNIQNLSNLVIVIDGPRPITLCYWVHGDLHNQIQFVQAFPHNTIEALRRTIISKDTDLQNCSEREVVLYKFPVPVCKEDKLANVLESVKFSHLETLRTGHTLSAAFASFDPESILHLVVVVMSKMIPVECWIRGSDDGPFTVMTSMKNEVSDLKNQIKHSNYLDGYGTRFDLFKIPRYHIDDLAEILGDTESGARLGRQTLLKVFEDMALYEPLCVVIGPNEKLSKGPPSNCYPPRVDHPVASARKTFLSYIPNQRLSCSGAPSSIRSRQWSPNPISCGHPISIDEAIPPSLLHPIFGRFVDECQNILPTWRDNVFADDVVRVMSDLYNNEAQRIRSIVDVFTQYGISFDLADKTPYPMDATLSVNNHHYAIAEYKNEAGQTSAEPYFQAIGYYKECTRDTALIYYESPLPCILVVIFGSYIEFSAAVWNIRPSIRLLADPISFKFYPTDTHIQPSVARRLAAFRRAIVRLKEYYEKLQATRGNLPLNQAQLFPYPTSYKSGGAKRAFRYVKQLDPAKLVFEGREGNNKIFIKFTKSYSPTVHKFFEAQQCAPTLRGMNKLPGGWYMVVMDLLEGYTGLRNSTCPPYLLQDVAAIFEKLHLSGYVHGDVRDANIMVLEDKRKFMIVDFDWAGTAGEVRYPAGINFKEIIRPAGATDGRLIETSHDKFMIHQLQGHIVADDGEREVQGQDCPEYCLENSLEVCLEVCLEGGSENKG